VRILLVGLLIAVAVAIPSEAFAHDGVDHGPVVATGTSPAGIPWRIKLGLSHNGHVGLIDFHHFFTPGQGLPTFHYKSALMLPLLPRFVFQAFQGGDLPPATESDLSGFMKRAVSTLSVRMTNGTVLPISPQSPRVKLKGRWRWASKLSFFDGFFANTEAPASVTGLSAAGGVLATSTARSDGFFFGLRPR
jgi:hypothetical protein